MENVYDALAQLEGLIEEIFEEEGVDPELYAVSLNKAIAKISNALIEIENKAD